MTAKLSRHHGTYKVLFEDVNVSLVFDHVRNGSSDLTAEVDVLVDLPGYGPLLMDKKLNLLSEVAQTGWAKRLQARCPAVHDWDGILTEACRLVKRAKREGEPSIRLGDAPQPPGGTWLLRGLVLSRLPAVFFGDGSAGKSLLALAVAETLQTGRSDLLGLVPSDRRNVLWLDWEFDPWEHRLRARSITGSESDVRYRRMSGALFEQLPGIEKEIAQHDIGYLVCDSAAYACGGKPEDSEQVNRFFDALRYLGLGTLLIAHETKEAGRYGDHDKPFGSVYWHDNVRASWYVQKTQDEQSESDKHVRLHCGLFNRKTNQGRLWRAMGFAVDITNDDGGDMQRCAFEREDVRDIEELRKNTPLREQIKRSLDLHARLRCAELAEMLDQKEDSIRKTLKRMERNKEVVVVDQIGNIPIYGLANGSVDLEDFPL